MSNELKDLSTLARKHNKVQTLIHYINEETLLKQHKKQEHDKASGIDKVTKFKYEENVTENIMDLLKRMKSFSYHPQAVRRTYIPKAGSDKLRPLGIPSYEDKLVQGAMTEVLDEIYETKFLDCSYGFRPGRNCHQAIAEIRRAIMVQKTGYILDADIKGFFDNLSHDWLMKFLENDIGDKNFLRYVVRFLKAGIMEDGKYYASEVGAPQGGCISAILANVYLHYVLDLWFEKKVKKETKGETHLVRYCDDFVVMFQYKDEAEKFYEELKERLKKFGLEIAEDKTKIIPFGRFKGEKEITFDFLGFTFVNAKTRNGKYKVYIKTAKKKMKVKRQKLKEWTKSIIQLPTNIIIIKLNRKLKGHYNYYGITGNYKSLYSFYLFAIEILFKQLRRRGQRDKTTWDKFNKILKLSPIAKPKIRVNLAEIC